MNSVRSAVYILHRAFLLSSSFDGSVLSVLDIADTSTAASPLLNLDLMLTSREPLKTHVYTYWSSIDQNAISTNLHTNAASHVIVPCPVINEISRPS